MIFDENTHAEKMIETGFQLKPQYRRKELSVLYKYYASFLMKKDDIEKKLHDFCHFWLRDEYNYVKFIPVIDSIADFAKKVEIKKAKRIIFTKGELDTLSKIEEEILRRVLFIMMYFGKVDGFNYCNAKESEIFKLVKVNVRGEDRGKIVRELYIRGYINPTMTGGDKILCCDERLLLEDGSDLWIKSGIEDDIGLIVENVYDPIFDYWLVFGGKEIKTGVCAGCGKKIVKNSNRQKWCVACKEKHRLEEWKEQYRKKIE